MMLVSFLSCFTRKTSHRESDKANLSERVSLSEASTVLPVYLTRSFAKSLMNLLVHTKRQSPLDPRPRRDRLLPADEEDIFLLLHLLFVHRKSAYEAKAISFTPILILFSFFRWIEGIRFSFSFLLRPAIFRRIIMRVAKEREILRAAERANAEQRNWRYLEKEFNSIEGETKLPFISFPTENSLLTAASSTRELIAQEVSYSEVHGERKKKAKHLLSPHPPFARFKDSFGGEKWNSQLTIVY